MLAVGFGLAAHTGYQYYMMRAELQALREERRAWRIKADAERQQRRAAFEIAKAEMLSALDDKDARDRSLGKLAESPKP